VTVPAVPPEQLMSLAEVAAYLQVSIGTVYDWRAKGDAPRGYRVGKHVRVRRSSVDEWLLTHADAA
jgi:excisionase family DNA binding protein